jgi:nucleoside-diphosphate-sugar epimerase
MSQGCCWVTGAAGFIGSHLVRSLLQGHENSSFAKVVAIDSFTEQHVYGVAQRRRRWAQLRTSSFPADSAHDGVPALQVPRSTQLVLAEGDIGDERFLGTLLASTGPPTAVAHLAALPGVRFCETNPQVAQYANVTALSVLLQFLKDSVPLVRFLFVSSSSVYGDQALPWVEQQPVKPLNVYARSKAAGERLVLESGLWHTVVRPFSVYGPDGRPDMCVDVFMCQLYAGQAPTIFGDGSALRDFTYVDDVVRALVTLLRPGLALANGETFNLGASSPHSVASVISHLAKELGLNPQICDARSLCIFQPAAVFESGATCADSSKAGWLLGWQPHTSLEEGLHNTVEFFLQAVRRPSVTVRIINHSAEMPTVAVYLRALKSVLAQRRSPQHIVLHWTGADADLRLLETRATELLRSAGCSSHLSVTPVVYSNVGVTAPGPERTSDRDYVAFLDVLDEWLPLHLERCILAVASLDSLNCVSDGNLRGPDVLLSPCFAASEQQAQPPRLRSRLFIQESSCGLLPPHSLRDDVLELPLELRLRTLAEPTVRACGSLSE